MTDKHGIARRAHYHAEDGEPHVRHAHRWIHPITDTQHVTHGFKEGIRVLLTPRVILKERERDLEHDFQVFCHSPRVSSSHEGRVKYICDESFLITI